MSICFIANYYKTYFFHEIAKQLISRRNIKVYWIVVNKIHYKFLKEEYGEEYILYLPKNKVLESENNVINEFKLNELVYGDRVLKYNYVLGISYLIKIQKPIYDFIKGNSISYIFGELTWAHELLIHRISIKQKELNCKYLNPHTTRIPKDRFAFFKDEYQSEIYIIDDNYSSKSCPEDLFIPQKPEYLKLNDAIQKKNSSVKGRLKRLKRLLTSENLDKNDITLFTNRDVMRFLQPIKNEIYKEFYKWVPKVSPSSIAGKKYILITLHKQPEASIDVLGRYVEDQSANIINLWRQMPDDWYLVIKEHTNAVGDRPYQFYKKLLKFRNILIIKETEDSYSLMEKAQAVFTVSGTIAYEAALKNIKALVLCDVFFNFSFVKKIDNNSYLENTTIDLLLTEIPNKNVDDNCIKNKIYYNSAEGIISDPVSNSKCNQKENIQKVVDLFIKAITKL